MANSEDPDEMQHNAAFHQGMHVFSKIKTTFRNRNTSFQGQKYIIL